MARTMAARMRRGAARAAGRRVGACHGINCCAHTVDAACIAASSFIHRHSRARVPCSTVYLAVARSQRVCWLSTQFGTVVVA